MRKKRTKLDLVKPLFQAWGREGGKKRTAMLTPEERREIARKAARARWKTKRAGPTR